MFVNVRVSSAEERAQWHAAARAAGYRTLSAFIRSKMVQAVYRHRPRAAAPASVFVCGDRLAAPPPGDDGDASGGGL